MKRIIALLGIAVMVFVSAQAQTTTSQPKPEDYMTAEQLVEFQKDVEIAKLEKKLETYGNWVGVGGEVGEAIHEGLSAVVDVADQFGTTDVGKFTMVLVAWKVIGKDVVRILLGFIFIALVTWLFMKVYRNTYVAKRRLVKRTPQGWFRRALKEYQLIEPNDDWEGANGVRVLMLFMYVGAIGIAYAIMFA